MAGKAESASTIKYVLCGADKEGGGRQALAEADLSLRQLWQSSQDVVRSALPLFSPERVEVAEASVTVHALAAVRALGGPRRPRAAREGAAARGAQPTSSRRR